MAKSTNPVPARSLSNTQIFSTAFVHLGTTNSMKTGAKVEEPFEQ
jgi:hypothetical protein